MLTGLRREQRPLICFPKPGLGDSTRDNGKENGNYYSILGLYRDNGKENGNYYSIFIPKLSSQKQGEGATMTRAHTQKQGRHPRSGVIGRLMTETVPSDEEGLWGCQGLEVCIFDVCI